LGVRAEIHFVPVYKDQPSFGQIHQYLTACGFELLNLDYDGRGYPRSKYTLPQRFGRLIACDAVWIKKLDGLLSQSSSADELIEKNIIRMAAFLMFNHATDIAVDLLIEGLDRHGCDYSFFLEDPLFQILDRQVQILFKDLQYQPYGDSSLSSVYEHIFQKPMKVMHHFYESDILN
jgi:hypothetical protein